MDIIKKKISLEPFVSRQKSTIPFVGMKDDEYYPNLNWGKIPYSVNFNDDDVWTIDPETKEKKRVPSLREKLGDIMAVKTYGSGVRKLGKLTFSEMMEMYHKVKSGKAVFPENDDDLTDEEIIEIEKLNTVVSFIDSKKIIDENQTNPDPCCNPCFVPTQPEPAEMDSGEYYVNDAAASMNICLVQSTNLIGSYTFATKDWVPGKRYFEGDKVIYDGKTFKLKNFDNTIEISGSVMNCMEQPAMVGRFITGNTVDDFVDCQWVSEEMFVECTVNSEQEIVDLGYIYARMEIDGEEEPMYRYYIRPSWGGYYNGDDGGFYFDELMDDRNPEMGFKYNGKYETVHWKVDDAILSHGVFEVSGCDSGNTGDIHIGHLQDRSIGFNDNAMSGLSWETKLSNFIRTSKTLTDDSEILPGKLNRTNSEVLDLIYSIGTVKNVDTTTDKPIGDFLADIQVIPDTQGLLSIMLMTEDTRIYEEIVYGQVIQCTSYTYTHETVWSGVTTGEEKFIGSTEKDGNDFKIYDEWSNLIFDSSIDIEGNDYMIYVSTGNELNAIEYEIDNGRIEIPNPDKQGEYTVIYTTPGKNTRSGYTTPGIPSGQKSFNGGGFIIQPTGGTETEYDVIAPGLLKEYGAAGDFVLFQNMDTYEKLVRNWNGETGTIILKYYIGAEVELCENKNHEEVYMYNGGEKRAIYEDRYRWTAHNVTKRINGTDRTFVYLDLDYDSEKEPVVYENLDNYEDEVIKSNIAVTSYTMTEGGEPVSANFQNADYFMEDYQIGLSFIANNNDNVYIDRGTAAAFERHLRISEADTLDNLAAIGNGLFKMKE